MISNQRPYQLVLSKTGNAALAAPIAVGARICGLGLGILASLLPERRICVGDAARARAEAERLFPRPDPSPDKFPPLPPTDPTVDVSVIVPAYNAERYITECMDSVLSQAGGHRVQLIAVNDRSTDRTGELLSRYCGLPDVTLLELHRGGSAARARNEGLLHAVGRYILFLDSDDVLAPGAIDSLLRAVGRLEADVVQGGWQYIDEGGSVMPTRCMWVNVGQTDSICPVCRGVSCIGGSCFRTFASRLLTAVVKILLFIFLYSAARSVSLPSARMFTFGARTRAA